jgi:hypothetical protein
MLVKVKTLVGKIFNIDGINPEDPIDKVKQNLASLANVPVENQKLIHKGRVISKGTNSLKEEGIKDGGKNPMNSSC